MNNDIFKDVFRFMCIGGQNVRGGDYDQTALYMGLILEEVGEMVSRLGDEGHVIKALSDRLKSGQMTNLVTNSDYEKLLDDFIDIMVVAIGATISISPKAREAIEEVLQANLAKFPAGEVIRDENGKIQKPAGWKAPDLKKYLSGCDLRD